jgi:hypothetical protein
MVMQTADRVLAKGLNGGGPEPGLAVALAELERSYGFRSAIPGNTSRLFYADSGREQSWFAFR